MPAMSLTMLRRAIVSLAVTLVATSVIASSAAAADQFGRLFPTLPAFVDPTTQQIADLAQTLLEPNADTGNNVDVPSVFTYFGQFIDHDLTLDTSPPPAAPVAPDDAPERRTFRFRPRLGLRRGPAGQPAALRARRTALPGPGAERERRA